METKVCTEEIYLVREMTSGERRFLFQPDVGLYVAAENAIKSADIEKRLLL